MSIINKHVLHSLVWGQGTDRQNPVLGQGTHRQNVHYG